MLRPVVPPLNCHFLVEFENPDFKEDTGFYSVLGLGARRPVNVPFVHIEAQFDNLILKRAFEPESSLLEWTMNTINNHLIQFENLTISLLNSDHKIISAWSIEKAIPVSWGVEELHAQETRVLLEIFELRYDYFQVVKGNGEIVAPKPE